MLNKKSLIMIFSSILMINMIMMMNMNFYMDMKFLMMMNHCFQNSEWSLNMEKLAEKFLLMVMMVTSMVTIYSSKYMENYNNKKFTILILMFISSMIILVSSNSYLNLILGWDTLGLSSVFLVMFYPNKTTMYNSFMTMIYNRLGDVMIILCMIYYISSNLQYPGIHLYNKEMVLLMMMVCLTKSAQFPLSAWLPAAMSAPTPISSLVHSSTLVTAGIFLILKMENMMMVTNTMKMMTLLSIMSFLMGGIMALLEKDSKKLVAFSTMSQMSMIMLMISMNFKEEGIYHMMYHAFFKSLLFASLGFMFMMSFSIQSFKLILNNSTKKIMKYMTWVSVFMMTGLMFSSSFYTKDIMMETLKSNSDKLIFLLFITGSMISIYYCNKILNISITNSSNIKFFYSKSMMSLFFIMFSIMSYTIFYALKYQTKYMEIPLIETEMIFMISLVFLFVFMMKFKLLKMSIYFNYLNSSNFFTKIYMFSNFKKFMINKMININIMEEYFMLKKNYMIEMTLKLNMKENSFKYLMLMFMIFIMKEI